MNLFQRRKRVQPPADDPFLRDASEVAASGLFDPAWYMAANPDVADYGDGPLAHFLRHGIKEERDPGPDFSHRTCREHMRGQPDNGEPLFLSVLRTRTAASERLWAPSADERRRHELRHVVLRSGLFDGEWYLQHHNDLRRLRIDPLAHYIDYGIREDRQPGPDFDPEFYGEQHPDYLDQYPTLAEHYIHLGRPNGFAGRGPPPYQRWINRYDLLTADDVAAITADCRATSRADATVVMVLDAAACRRSRLLLDAIASQIGGCGRALLCRGRDVAAQDWDALAEASRGVPALQLAEAADAGLDGIADGLLLLCLGAVVLRPHALYVLARSCRIEGWLAAYCDHDMLDGETRVSPAFKPQTSPLFQRSTGYVGRVVALRLDGETREKLAGLDLFGGTDPRDTISELIDRLGAAAVARVPFILYHRPAMPADAAPHKPADGEPANGKPVCAPPAGDDAGLPSVSIVIPTRDGVELLRACIDSLVERTDYPAEHFEIVVVDNDSALPDTFAYLAQAAARHRVRVVASPGVFNYAKINNDAVATSTADILVLLNNDTTVNRPGWLRTLTGFAADPTVGIVGCKLLYPGGTIQHGGVILGIQGVGAHRLAGLCEDGVDPPDVTRELSAVTGACMAIRRDLFDALGGLDPALEVAFNDVKLCAGALQAGYRNIYVAEPLMIHHESRSRGYDLTVAMKERNAREAAYVVGEFASLFRDDPGYNPNLSLLKIDGLAFPPRVVRPWRRIAKRRRVLVLSIIHKRGYGVPVVLARQVATLRRHGYEVIVGGPVSDTDIAYEGCRRIAVKTPLQAGSFAVAEAIDAVIAHTPPFFNVARLLGGDTVVYAVDHGEPNPEFFEDRDRRRAVNLEKRHSIAFARRVFAISQTIHDQQYRRDAMVARNGNSHLQIWTSNWVHRREAIRRARGFASRFIVLNVCRFHEQERSYKGLERYIEVPRELAMLAPEARRDCTFVLAGRGDEEDVCAMEREGLVVLPNVSDAELIDLYAAADLYMNFSRWEGYNLGVGQALAMGLPVIASDIEAHREFPITTSNSMLRICTETAARVAAWRDGRSGERRPFIEDWTASTELIRRQLDADLTARSQMERPALPVGVGA